VKNILMQLISSTQGKGPSSTRLVYLVGGLTAVFSALVMTIGGTLVYCAHGKAEPAFWAAVVALWTAKLGIGGWLKTEQQKRTTEIVGKQPTGAEPAPAFGD
jgi:hypothetical protein